MLLIACALAACGKKGAPLPPLLRIPAPVGEPTVMRVDDEVFVRFVVPQTNVDGAAPADIARVEVYAITADREPTGRDDPEELRRLSTLVATEQVRRPFPPLPPLKPGAPEPPPLPPEPGVDQGAVVVVREPLNQSSRVPITLPELEPRATARYQVSGVRDQDVEPLPGPLVAPLEADEPKRYYYVVGVSRGGRYGPAQPFTPVPLGATSSAPGPPEVSYDEKTLTIGWKPAPDARGVKPPPLPDVLQSRSLAPEPPPTTYDVYESPKVPDVPDVPEVPGMREVEMPTPLTPAPVGALEFTVPITALDGERCFVVRPVDIIGGYHVRGPASPITCITLKDTFAPPAPRSLAAVASAGAINLIWDRSEAADLAGYRVLRGEAPGATLTPLTPEPISATTYVDREVRAGVTYIYAVVAVDKAGNRSTESNRVEETSRQ